MNETIQAKTADQPIILMQGVHKWYGQFHVLKDINLKVRQGERIVLCGPSGSGKSTTIRCLNRLEEHQQGRIVVDLPEPDGPQSTMRSPWRTLRLMSLSTWNWPYHLCTPCIRMTGSLACSGRATVSLITLS